MPFGVDRRNAHARHESSYMIAAEGDAVRIPKRNAHPARSVKGIRGIQCIERVHALDIAVIDARHVIDASPRNTEQACLAGDTQWTACCFNERSFLLVTQGCGIFFSTSQFLLDVVR